MRSQKEDRFRKPNDQLSETLPKPEIWLYEIIVRKSCAEGTWHRARAQNECERSGELEISNRSDDLS
jgi:hypothetical protein